MKNARVAGWVLIGFLVLCVVSLAVGMFMLLRGMRSEPESFQQRMEKAPALIYAKDSI